MDGKIGDGLDGTVSRSNQSTRIYHEETNGSQPKEPARSRRGVEKIDGYGNANVETSIDSIPERKRKGETTPLSDVPMSYRNEQKEPQPQRGC